MRFHGSRRRASSALPNNSRSEAVTTLEKNVQDIVRIELADRQRMGWSDHLADAITALAGSMTYVWLHVAWFTMWIALNAGLLGLAAFDEFPFGLLTMIVSLEAIFLSTFVLISQNRAARLADRRSHIDLQINMIAEQEITRLVGMVDDLQKHMGFEKHEDDAVAEMVKPMPVDEVAKVVDTAEAGG